METVSANQKARTYRRQSRHGKANAREFTGTRVGIGYIRISKKRDEQISDEIQKRSIIEAAERRGIDVVRWHIDYGESAFENKAPRDGFRDALRDIENGIGNTLIVYKVDRFYRNATSALRVRDDLHAWGGSLICASENLDTIDPTDFASNLTFYLLAQIAEMESVIKSDRITDWHAERLQNTTGALPPGGPRPFGYDRCRIDDGKGGTVPSLTVNDDEASVIREAVNLIMSGQGLKGVAAHLSTPTRKLSRSGLKHILTSETTAGMRYDGTTHYEGNWTAILDRDEWQALCATLNDPQRLTAGPRGERRHLLAGLMTCGACGHVMRSRTHKSGPRYACTSSTCYNSVAASNADAVVFDHLASNVDADAWQRARVSGRGNQVDVIDAFKRKLQVVTDTYLNSAGTESDEAEYQRARAMINERITAAQESTPVPLPDVDDFVKAWPTMDIDAKRLILNAWFETLTVTVYEKGMSANDRMSYVWRKM